MARSLSVHFPLRAASVSVKPATPAKLRASIKAKRSSCQEDERKFPAHLRCQCILRLARYFDPLDRHLQLEFRISALIRQGYVGRNPEGTDFIHRLHNNYERVVHRDLQAGIHPVESTASGIALIGCSGIGKTKSVERILHGYPRIIPHNRPFTFTQVVWLRLHTAFTTVMAPLGGILGEIDKPDWLAAIVRKHRHAFHPLHHLLFALFAERFAPAPMLAEVLPPRRKRITDPGFDGRLRDFASSGLGLRAVARALAVDPNTVRKRGAALGLVTTWKPWTPRPRPPKPPTGPLYRARWLALQHREPGLGRKALAARLSAEHTWLYRHDRNWLETHVPEPMIRPPPKPRTDWGAVDQGLAADLRAAAVRILGRIPPVRVTLAELERDIGHPGWIGKRRTKLPETVAALSAMTEEVEAFQLRRIAWARESLIRNGDGAPAWKVRRLAGLPERASASVERALTSVASTERQGDPCH